METKFHGRRVSTDKVIKSINVCIDKVIKSIIKINFCFLAFFARFYFILKKEMTQIIYRWRFVTVGGTREVYAVARLLPVLQFYTCLIY